MIRIPLLEMSEGLNLLKRILTEPSNPYSANDFPNAK
jgi:hypothetical protein